MVFSLCEGGPLAASTLGTEPTSRFRHRTGRFLVQTGLMPIAFNHTIVQARDAQASATFFSELMGLPAPRRWGPFLAVPVEHGATFDFAQVSGDEEVHPQHYAFLVTEEDFDGI